MQSLSGYEQYFAMARGVPGIEALDMSKFFDTNYHYLVPELTSTVSPKPDFSIFFDKIKRGQSTIGKEKAVPIIIGALLIGSLPACLADGPAEEVAEQCCGFAQSCFWRACPLAGIGIIRSSSAAREGIMIWTVPLQCQSLAPLTHTLSECSRWSLTWR